MLKKLLKYDLKNMYKFLSVFYILMIIFAIMTRLLFGMQQTIIAKVLSQISVGAMFSMMASSLINVLMRNWVRFKQTLYSDESYLIHTLPISKTTLYESKFILSIISLTTTLLIITISLFIAYYSKDKFTFLINSINQLINSYDISTKLFISSVIISLFLEIFWILQVGFLGIILGHKLNNNKITLSVVFGLSIYFISQLIVLLVIYLFGIFDNSIMLIFTNNVLYFSVLNKIMLLILAIYILMIFVINILCVKLLKLGVDIE